MGLQGVIKVDHIPKNKYTLRIQGMPPLTIVKLGELERELETTELPDRTRASGGQTKPSETMITLPTHHSLEIAAMEQWCQKAMDPVDPTYKVTAVLVQKSISGQAAATWKLTGVFAKKMKNDGLEMSNQGDMTETEYTLSIDQVSKLG